MKIEINRWDTKTIQVKFKDKDGNAVNISWCSVYMTVRKKETLNDADDSRVLFQKKITNHTNPGWWITEIPLGIAESSKPAGRYFYDFQIVYTTLEVNSTKVDEFIINHDSTKTNTL